MSAHDALNIPFEVDLCGRPVKVATLSIGDLFCRIEERVKKSVIDAAKMVLAGETDPSVRASALADVALRMPSGQELLEKQQEYLASIEGVAFVLHLGMQAAKRSEPEAEVIDEQEIIGHIRMEDVAILAPVISRIMGVDPDKKKSDQTDQPKS